MAKPDPDPWSIRTTLPAPTKKLILPRLRAISRCGFCPPRCWRRSPLAPPISAAGPSRFFGAVAAGAVLWEWQKLVSGAVWIVAGFGYAGALLAAPVILRHDAALGFLAIILLFAIVWTTDVLGYFAGRAIGGPKLMPAVSPKKTWSGAIAGAIGAMMVAVLVARLFGAFNSAGIAGIALLLSICSQAGDLLESWIKRQFGAKDASQLIPGHGGVMDRLDGFWAAALIACLIGVSRGGLDGATRGLLVW
ncbi:MAG: phosphatidate cytidylyltransferase [Pseudolabrys sp.]